MQDKIAACPKRCRLLQGTIAEESDHDLFRSRDPDDLLQREGLPMRSLFLAFLFRKIRTLLSPKRQAEQEHGCQGDLNKSDIIVAHVPTISTVQSVRQHIRSQRSTDSPHTVKPAHVPAGIMQSNVIIQRCIHSAGTQPIRNGP